MPKMRSAACAERRSNSPRGGGLGSSKRTSDRGRAWVGSGLARLVYAQAVAAWDLSLSLLGFGLQVGIAAVQTMLHGTNKRFLAIGFGWLQLEAWNFPGMESFRNSMNSP